MNYKDYFIYLNKREFIKWMDLISDTDDNPSVKFSAKEIGNLVEENFPVQHKSYYEFLYKKYKFKLIPSNTPYGLRNSLYFYDKSVIKIIGLIQDFKPNSNENKKSIIPSLTPLLTPSISISSTTTPSISVNTTITPSISISPTVTPNYTPSITPTSSDVYFYYVVRNCKTAVEFVGRSAISGLYNYLYPTVINLSTGVCLEITDTTVGPWYDYDLDTRLDIVDSCLDPVCLIPVPSSTPSVTPSVTITPSITPSTSPSYTLVTRQLYPNIKLYSYSYIVPEPVNVYIAEIDLSGNVKCRITGPENKGSRETYRSTTKKFVEDNNGQIGMNLHFFTHVNDVGLTTYLLGLGVSGSYILSNFENQPGPELDQSYAILGYAPGINIDLNNVASVVTRNPNYPGPGQSPVNESVTLKNAFAGSARVITNGVKTIPTYYTGGGAYPYGSSYLNPIAPPGGGVPYNNGNSWYDLTRSRAIIGISDDGTKMYLAVGEYVTSTGYGGIKVGELSDILINEHGVYNAINMDGGSSVGLVFKDPDDGIVKYINDVEAGTPREVGSNITFWNIPPSPGVTPTPSKTPSVTPSVTPPNGSIDATPSLTPTLTPSLTTAPPLQKFQVVYSLVGAVETGSAIISSRLTGSLLTAPGGPAAEPGRLISYVLTTDPTNPNEGAPNRLMFGVKRNNSYLNGNKGSFISASIKNLLPNKTYYYWIYDHNNDRYISESTERKVTTTPFKNLVGPYTYLGKFKTSPLTSSAYRFSASYAACVTSYSTIPLYYHVKLYNPDLFIHLGDMHYFDNAQEPRTPREYESAWQTVFASGSGYQAKLGQESTWSRPNYMPLLIRDTSFEYMWDDHDYGPNDSFGTTTGPNSNPSKAHAQTVYSLIFPHYKLPSTPYTYLSGSNNVAVSSQAIYHSFKKGRIKFIATDNRSEASNYTDPESDSKRIWSQEQEDWFKSEMTDTSCPVKVWICSYPWSGKDDTSPRWSGFSTYRKKIANFFTANSSSIGKIIILSGDAHMTAMDDGYYSEWYGTGSKVNPPISTHQSAPIDRTGGGFEGGPYILYGADFISPTTTSSLKDLTVNGANYSKAVNGLSSSYTIMNNRYGCMEVYDDLSNIEISMYSRSGTAKVSSLGGDYRMPIVNHKYSKWKLTLNTTNFNKDTGGKITETISFVDVHQKP